MIVMITEADYRLGKACCPLCYLRDRSEWRL